ncbi:MAG TPA: hypothetical protein VM366_12760 [Anaerolineae bacterium]|nr:hypothetical protein [Anaerolineae bacterium]
MSPETIKLILITIALIALLLSSCGKPEEPKVAHPPEGLLPASPKGYELYSWRLGREWYHTLVTATNRAKTVEEITAGENVVEDTWAMLTLRGIHDLEVTIERLPAGTALIWIGPQTLRRRGTYASIIRLPPHRHLIRVRTTCKETGIGLQVEG